MPCRSCTEGGKKAKEFKDVHFQPNPTHMYTNTQEKSLKYENKRNPVIAFFGTHRHPVSQCPTKKERESGQKRTEMLVVRITWKRIEIQSGDKKNKRKKPFQKWRAVSRKKKTFKKKRQMTNLGPRRHDRDRWFGWVGWSTPGIDPSDRSIVDTDVQQIKQVTLLLLLLRSWLQWTAPVEHNVPKRKKPINETLFYCGNFSRNG